MYNDPDAQTMNYNIAIYGGVVVLSTVYYFFFGKIWIRWAGKIYWKVGLSDGLISLYTVGT